MISPDDRLVITCEHASPAISARYADVKQRAGQALLSHRGYDPGARELARYLARSFQARCFEGKYSRLLVELNRSLHHAQLWSEFSKPLSKARKSAVLKNHYSSYRQAVEAHMSSLVGRGLRVMHVSVHSFVPKLGGEVRRADIGLLYDPRRAGEKHWAARWKSALEQEDPTLRIRRNYPYLGVADGFVTHLRKRFGNSRYLGIELEVNQRWVLEERKGWNLLKDVVRRSLALSLDRE